MIQQSATTIDHRADFYSLTRISGYISYVSIALCAFILLSFVALPIDKTRRHYLNVCLVIGMILLELGLVVPFSKQPEQCYDMITPNYERTSLTCAWSGALIVFGGSAVNMWILVRAISMHLQICWDIVPGKVYFWGAQVVGWLLSAALVSIELSLSGVSQRFGDYCHVNAHKSLGFWGPLLGLAGLSLLFQLSTFAYCLKVYLKHSFTQPNPDTESSQGLSAISHRSASARAVFRRVRTVLHLQWRGIAIAVVVVVDVIFLSLVFITLDNQLQREAKDLDDLLPWLTCIVIKQDKNECLSLAKPLAVNERLLIATLIMLSVVGIQAFLLISTREMFTGWVHLIRSPFQSRFRSRSDQQDFVSLNEPRFSTDKRPHEMLNYGTPDTELASSERISAKSGAYISPLTRIENTDYRQEFMGTPGDDERAYHSPKRSFSNPRPPSTRQPNLAWANHLQAQMGHGLQPTIEEDKF